MAEYKDNDYDPSKDPKRKAKSNDPGWKYAFWPNLNNKDLVECSLCHKQMFSGIKRLKQHLAKGFVDVEPCPKTTPAIMREIHEYIRKNARNKSITLDDDDDDGENEEELTKLPSSDSSSHPSSRTATKRMHSILDFFNKERRVVKQNESVAIRKSREEVIEERHSKGPTQSTIEWCTKSDDEKERVKMHIAYFFYENGISFSAANSQSYKIMIESIGQFGPGLKPINFNELRGSYLQRLKKEKKEIKNHVYEATDASYNIQGHNLRSSRLMSNDKGASSLDGGGGVTGNDVLIHSRHGNIYTFTSRSKRRRDEEEPFPDDDKEVDDDYGLSSTHST